MLALDQAAREAIGRILRDQPMRGDGHLFLSVLTKIRERVEERLVADCALREEQGRRKLAHDLIEVAEQELERVLTPKPPDADSGLEPGRVGIAADRFGTSPGIKRSTRRHGPTAEHGSPGYSDDGSDTA